MRRAVPFSKVTIAALVGWVWSLSGCEATRSLHVLDGESQNLGGARDDVTGSGGDPLGTGGGTGGSMESGTLIDDLSDCDALIRTAEGRNGYWYHFAVPQEVVERLDYDYGEAPDASWGTQECGIYLSGACPACSAVGVGFELENAWNLSAYRGIRVSFESETSLWSVIVSTNGGYSEYVELLPTGRMSAERILWFNEIYPGNGFEGLEFSREVQFTVGEADRAEFALALHHVELVE